jgi:hypothetical protein
MALTSIGRFDGREIRVDKASDTGPKGNYGRGGGSYSGRGGYAQPPPQMPYAGGQAAYGMPNAASMYPQAAYGRGSYPPHQPTYGTPPAQGKNHISLHQSTSLKL